MLTPLLAEAVHDESSLWILKEFATVVTVAVGLVTIFSGVAEYRRRGAQKRLEHYLQMRKKFDENPQFIRIRKLLDDDPDREIQKLSKKDRSDYAHFFEEIALLMNSGLLKSDVAFYMFGFEALQCWKYDLFWNPPQEDQRFQRDDRYWALLRNFVEQMEEKEKSFKFDPRRFYF